MIKVYLFDPYLNHYPVGIYTLINEDDVGGELLNGTDKTPYYHVKERYVICSSLLMELL
jgi:hypothetical protein